MANRTNQAPPPSLTQAWKDSPFEPVGVSMLNAGHAKWGFVIYRGVYGDDDAWEYFLESLKIKARETLTRYPNDLQQYGASLAWTVIQDPALQDASNDIVRERFREWIDTRSVERDGYGADSDSLLDNSPRYQCCLYVDAKSFNSVMKKNDWPRRMKNGHFQLHGCLVLIDSRFGHRPLNEIDEQELEDIRDGHTEQDMEEIRAEWEAPIDDDVGWMYVEATGIISMYNALALGEPNKLDSWDAVYVWPAHQVSAPSLSTQFGMMRSGP